jgi:predicted PurR-regulated permease PerM
VAPQELSQALYRAIARAIYLALGIGLLVTFIDATRVILLFFILAAIVGIALSPPINWLESRRVPRVVGTLLVLIAVLGSFVGVGFMVAPQITNQWEQLSQDLPAYVQSVSGQVMQRLGRVPGLEELSARPEDAIRNLLPAPSAIVSSLGSYSITIFSTVVGALILLSSVAFMLINPRPLLRGLLGTVPIKFREPFAAAFARGSQSVVQWVWANMVIGAVEAVAATIFLSVMGVPGALVWGTLAFFAELVPQLGAYLMAIPPIIVAFAVDPQKALWTIVFYVALQNVVNSVVAPPIRSRTMSIHPVSEIFMVLALTLAFGFIGAIIAAPMVGFVKAFYDEFYKPRQPDDDRLEALVDDVLVHRVPAADS